MYIYIHIYIYIYTERERERDIREKLSPYPGPPRRTCFKHENVYVYMCGPPVLRVVVWMDGMANPRRESRGRTGVQVKARQVNA